MRSQVDVQQPRIGVGVIVCRQGRVLLGQRRGAHGAGSWALPGGHLEWDETPEACAAREVLEETGLSIEALQRGPWTHDLFEAEGRQYVTVFLRAQAGPGEPRVMEPDKCLGWAWFDWDQLPQPLFLPLHNLRASGYRP